MRSTSEKYYKRDFWIQETQQYIEPHFRLQKAARIVNRLAGPNQCELLDVGCGPATLMHFVRQNVRYYGIDLAIHKPAPNLLQADFVESPIGFGGKRFDIVLAQGVFEYIGKFQSEKLAEIGRLLKKGGTFVASYVNFNHRAVSIYPPYNNVQSFDDFRASLLSTFEIDRYFPTSHHWHHHEPHRKIMKALQMHVNVNVPYISRRLAVEYFFICSVKGS